MKALLLWTTLFGPVFGLDNFPLGVSEWSQAQQANVVTFLGRENVVQQISCDLEA